MEATIERPPAPELRAWALNYRDGTACRIHRMRLASAMATWRPTGVTRWD
jgi:hypothetical protein